MKEFANVHAESLFHQADALIDEKKYEEAYLILQSLIERDPPFGKAYNHMGWFYQWKVKDFKKAEECYKKAIELIPEYYAGYSNYISILSGQQRWKELEALIEKAMKVPSSNRGTLCNEMGMMLERQGKYEEAIEAYKKFAVESTENAKFDEAMKSMERCKEKMKVLR